jgi:hypothetical protein
MYEMDSLDTVVELADAPSPDNGAPLPLVISDERHLLLARELERMNKEH